MSLGGHGVSMLSHCSACQKPIRFVRTRRARSMPVDAELLHTWLAAVPAETPGTITLVDHYGGVHRGLPCAPPPDLDRLPAEMRQVAGYVPHWITCTSPQRFRRRPRR
jgi:hypothetical protein